MIEAIGGYFSLELPRHEEYHTEAVKLNTGRNCLEYILRCRKPNKVYIPFYTCDATLEPFQKLNINYEFYHIDTKLEIFDNISLYADEYLLYTNYFGLKQTYIEQLADRFGHYLIIDNTQAFFAKAISGIDTFYTCRKFFGVPDGAYLYTNAQPDFEIEQDASYERMTALLKRIDVSPETGYADFVNTESSLSNQPIRRMSKLTERIMQSIDYSRVSERRRLNYNIIHKVLGKSNLLHLDLETDATPMVYPYLSDTGKLREKLIQNRIYVARYWPNIVNWTEKETIEYNLMQHLLPLPIDQRYGEFSMDSILKNMVL